MYKCKHFKIQELVPEQVYKDRGEQAWLLLDDRALETLDQLRVRFGKITVNNWHKGGSRNWSGLRTKDCPIGAKYSQHQYGRAFDCIMTDITPQEVIDYVLENQDEFPFLNAVETGTDGWFHFDVRNCLRIQQFPA